MRHTKKEAITQLLFRLFKAGFGPDEAQALRGIAMTLSRWDEAECNGTIQRDKATDKPFRVYRAGSEHRFSTADREAGATKRLIKILTSHPELTFYRQGDPRGCSLYIVPVDDIKPGQSLDCVYSSIGIAVF